MVKHLNKVWELLKRPAKANGYIDYEELFKLVVGRLRMPISYLDELTYAEIVLLIEQDTEDKQEHYETMALAFQLGYTNAHTKGKNKTLFSKNKSANKSFESIEEKQQAFNELKQLFEN